MTDPTPSLALRKADSETLDRIEELLDANGLPHEAVRSSPECFYVARSGGALVGIGGVERYGSAGLLRSVAVPAPMRGAGYGTALCDALEERARVDGVETLYLLTTTAAEFFARRGYERVGREAAPERVRGTSQFADRCPDSATCMRKRLDG
ncbi:MULTISPECIES: arsenic resistance N-acetyltransferase ArsN2 [Halorussus]|uniref:arsenic resistance N-acetyltransferase ArsN2 n=1 Tax=Halorussus TaxID=1070314 RepID=UPI000E20EA39|nr:MULTISPECIES: arsenic resistance N-acetyltransferase ArsN2 [Halorussus]NHN61206.1 GNAT family N-acetyltransferase [Halorussus sp. JP-T4]